MDEPDGCVWQGFIAATPGHPFLAKAIETVVNQVLNRYTSVDIDATFCPSPNYKVLHNFDVLFTAGPCLLGASINRVLGRHGQTPFEPGELTRDNLNATEHYRRSVRSENLLIPGRTIILKQDKWDMGAHRFTNINDNIVVGATDLQDSDDRLNKAKNENEGDAGGGGAQHYSKAHGKSGIYGRKGLYVNHERADKEVRIAIEGAQQWATFPLDSII
jgi:hypothetical protein